MSHDAFLRKIRESAGDDAPRLVYADWLDETGAPADAARAAFIRLCVKLASMPDFDPRKPGLEERADDLLAAHERSWLGDWPAEVLDWAWERGFVAAAAVPGDQLAGVGGRLFAVHPVSRLRVVAPAYRSGQPAWPGFHDRPWLAGLDELDLRGDQWRRVPGGVVGNLLRSPYLTGLRTLRLGEPQGLGVVRAGAVRDEPGGPGPDGSGRDLVAHLLAGAFRTTLETIDIEKYHIDLGEGQRFGRNWERFPGLKEIRLTECQFGNAILRGLVGGPARARLARLGLARSGAGRFTLDDLLGGGPLPALRELDLSLATLKPSDLERVLDGPRCPALRVLHLNGRRWPEDDEPTDRMPFARAVAGTGFWARATGLSLQSHRMTAADVAPLVRAPRPAGLRELDLSDNPIGRDGVTELCGADWLGRLTRLGLGQTVLDADGCGALAECRVLGGLRELDLGGNRQIGSKGLSKLVSGPGLKRLVSLGLSNTNVTVEGLDAVLNSGAMPHLRELSLSFTGIGADEVRVITRSPRLKRLRRLDLKYMHVDATRCVSPHQLGLPTEVFEELARAPDLSPLLRLDLTGVPVNDHTLAALRHRLGPRLLV